MYNQPVKTLDVNKKEINHSYQAEYIINTIPWTEFEEIAGINDSVYSMIAGLKYSSIVIEYYPQNLNTSAQWIYYPNLNHFAGADGIHDCFINRYAYPLDTIGKNEKMRELLSFMESKKKYGPGRWGEWQHYNSDVVVKLAIKLLERL